MLKVIILENNNYQAKYIRKLVEQRRIINPTPNDYDLKVILQTGNPEKVIKAIKPKEYLAIIDIELENKLNGIDVAEKIRLLSDFAEILFVTGYKEYLPFTVSRRIEPLDYIYKGNDITSITNRFREDIDEAYKRYQAYLNNPKHEQNFFIYEPINGVKKKIDLNDLYYIESIKNRSRQLRIVGKNIRVEYHSSLAQISSNNLLRISQSCFINPLMIKEFNRKQRLVYFDNNHSIFCKVSFRKLKDLDIYMNKKKL